VVGLQDAALGWPKLFQFRFEQLRFLICNGFLVENEDVGDVVGVDLPQSVSYTHWTRDKTYLFFEILEYLRSLLLHQV
jgi:hypothetical protein